MICKTCNIPNSEGARFCSNCGGELAQSTVSSQSMKAGNAHAVNAAVTPANESDDDEVTRVRAAISKSEAATVVASSASSGVSAAQNIPGDSLLGRNIESKYRIDVKLGAGGMGAVYRATRLLIGDEVAVKILHSEQTDPRAAERFRREAQAAARLKHPNAVNIYDFGVTDDGLRYLVMELVEGQSLHRIIKEQGPLTPSASAEIINQVSAALDEAHRHNIIHRDIKPDNIIVNVSATGLRVKVLDFGIAKLRDDAVGNLTQTGSILGTPHYMSPEQCLGEELDGRADIYSLGVVLYEMLTGTVPFNSPTPAAVVVQHVNQSPAPPRVLNASIPTSVESTVLHALEKRREDRPQSAGALAEELANAVRNPSVSARAATANGSANQFPSTPTQVVHPQSFAGGFATSRNVERDTLGSNNRSNTTRVVGLTVLATVLLLGVGGLCVRMLLGTSGERSNAAADGSNVRKDESASINQLRPTSTETTQPAITNDSPTRNSSPDVLSSVFSKTFSGEIGKYGIKMSLRRNGDSLSGTYVYTRHGVNISLTGSIDSYQNVEMYGYDDNGTQIDVFKGRFVSSSRMEGQWSKPNGSRSLPFTLTQQY
jgi:serine/threonine protein kinase